MKKNDKDKAAATAVTTMRSLDELTNLLETPLKCRFKLDGRVIELDVKRLPADLAERQRAIIRAVQPPYVRERNDYDPLNADYLKRRAVADDTARCLAVYYCCPIISAKKVCANDAEILALVQSALPRHLQELIALTAEGGGLQLMKPAEAANFTAPDGLES